VSLAQTAEAIEMPFGLRTRVSEGAMYYMGVQIPMGRGNFEAEMGEPIVKWTVCGHLCKNG